MGIRGRDQIRHFMPIALACLGFLFGTPTARAEDAPQFGIRPANPTAETTTDGYFALTAQPGNTVHDAVVVANPGTVPIKVLLYAVDATSGQNGGAIYLNNDDPRADVGAWITLDETSVDLPPQQQMTVSFTMSLPDETPAGQHLGGIVAQFVPADTNVTALSGGGQSHGFGITTVTRALVAMLVNVGGQPATPSLKVTDAQLTDLDGLPTLTLTLENDGTSLLKARGEVTMLDATGASALSSKLALDTLVPRSTIRYPVQADPPSSPSTYRVHVSLEFGGAAPAVFDGTVTVMAKPAPTAITPGRTRALDVSPTPDSASAPAPAATTIPAKSEGISPTIAVLGGIVGALAILVIGLSIFIVRARRTKWH